MMGFGESSDRPWAISEEAAEPIVRDAVDAGVTFFDTADMYDDGASEVVTGRGVGAWSVPRHSSCTCIPVHRHIVRSTCTRSCR